MTTRTISPADIAALQAIRSVIADATGHPGQQAAIEAIDRLAKANPEPVRSHNGYDGRLSDTSYADVPRDAGDPGGQRQAHVQWTSRDPGFDIKIPQGQDLYLSLRRAGSDTSLLCWPLGLRDDTDVSRRLFKLDVYAMHDSGHIMAPRANAVTEDAPAEMDTCDDFDCDEDE